jgi:hypothetical protein
LFLPVLTVHFGLRSDFLFFALTFFNFKLLLHVDFDSR